MSPLEDVIATQLAQHETADQVQTVAVEFTHVSGLGHPAADAGGGEE